MKAQIHLFLKDNDRFNGIFDGKPIDFINMLELMTQDSIEMETALCLAAATKLKARGEVEIAKKIWNLYTTEIQSP